MLPDLAISASRRYGSLSPLRYPGGKSSLAGLFEDIIATTGRGSETYVEPYAGGAGAGIALLLNDVVDRVVINDFDPAVYSFWDAALHSTERFLDTINSIPLTIPEWKNQREIYRQKTTASAFDLGFAFFYLNRTNRSGVLTGGVIGGLNQQGHYKMDARFNRETLIQRISNIAQHRDQIAVSDLDGRTVIRNYARTPRTFMYVDPPYVKAGSRLYLNAFSPADHRALAHTMADVDRAHWIMTYDIDPLIESLYDEYFKCHYSLNYSARHPGMKRELLISSSELAPFFASRLSPTSPSDQE